MSDDPMEDLVLISEWEHEYGNFKFISIPDRVEGPKIYWGCVPFEGDQIGFEAMFGEWAAEDNQGVWIEPVAHIVAFFDGIRHLYWFPATQGYVNYPHIKTLKFVVEKLDELVKLHCKEWAVK